MHKKRNSPEKTERMLLYFALSEGLDAHAGEGELSDEHAAEHEVRHKKDETMSQRKDRSEVRATEKMQHQEDEQNAAEKLEQYKAQLSKGIVEYRESQNAISVESVLAVLPPLDRQVFEAALESLTENERMLMDKFFGVATTALTRVLLHSPFGFLFNEPDTELLIGKGMAKGLLTYEFTEDEDEPDTQAPLWVDRAVADMLLSFSKEELGALRAAVRTFLKARDRYLNTHTELAEVFRNVNEQEEKETKKIRTWMKKKEHDHQSTPEYKQQLSHASQEELRLLPDLFSKFEKMHEAKVEYHQDEGAEGSAHPGTVQFTFSEPIEKSAYEKLQKGMKRFYSNARLERTQGEAKKECILVKGVDPLRVKGVVAIFHSWLTPSDELPDEEHSDDAVVSTVVREGAMLATDAHEGRML